jgi:hypothetical protein
VILGAPGQTSPRIGHLEPTFSGKRRTTGM